MGFGKGQCCKYRDGVPALFASARRGKRGAIVVMLDHTEMLAAEREIRKNREMLLAIMNNSTAIITLKDLSGRYEFVNRRFESFFDLRSLLLILLL